MDFAIDNTDEKQKMVFDAYDGRITLARFDEVIEGGEVEYHGFYITLEFDNLTVAARKYDAEPVLHIESNLDEQDTDMIRKIRRVAYNIFETKKLALHTDTGVKHLSED